MLFCPTPFFSTKHHDNTKHDDDNEDGLAYGSVVRPLRRSRPVGLVEEDCRNDKSENMVQSSSPSNQQRTSLQNSNQSRPKLRAFRTSGFGTSGHYGANFIINPPKERRCHWKKTKDPASKKWYYYHELTRESQWEKPLELATGAELDAMLRRVEEQKRFFREMESNVYDALSKGDLPGGSHPPVIGDDRSNGMCKISKHDTIFSWSACSAAGRYTSSTYTDSICTDSDRSIDSSAWMTPSPVLNAEEEIDAATANTPGRERRGRHMRIATH